MNSKDKVDSLRRDKRNFSLYCLVRCFEYYLARATSVKPQNYRDNEAFQREYWSKSTLFYRLKERENYDTEYYRTFDALFSQAVSDAGVCVCLDIGCGSFNHILRLQAGWPDLQFIGIDISEYSAKVYDTAIKDQRPGIQFVLGSLIHHPELLEQIDLFYTFAVFMYFSPEELEKFLSALRDTPRPIRGIIVEPFFVGANGKLSQSLPGEFRHDFPAYFARYGFTVHKSVTREHWKEENYPMLFAYFSNHPGEGVSTTGGERK
jgi:cyclopropane fatty-acyl-phospholipid synthase-like methyltransferase